MTRPRRRRPDPPEPARPAARRAVLRPGRGPLPAGDRPEPARRDVPRHPHRGPPARRRRPRRRRSPSWRRSAAPRRDRGARRRRAVRRRSGFERDLEVHNIRRAIFDTAEVRTWERRSTALDVIGDALFLVFARDFAPLPERLDAIASRLEAVPTYLEQSRDPGRRAAGPGVAAARDRDRRPTCRRSSTRSSPPGAVLAEPERRRLDAAADTRPRGDRRLRRLARRTTLAERDRRLGARAASDTTSSSSCARSTASTPTRSSRSARTSSRCRRPPGSGRRPRSTTTRPRPEVIDRLKSDHPATFAEALEAYRDVDGPGAPAPDRPRHRDRPAGRADRGHRDPRVPAQRHPVRGLLLAAEVRSVARRASTSSRRRSATTRTRCASTTSARSATRASTRRIPATTSS